MTTNCKPTQKRRYPDDPSSVQVYLCVKCSEIFKIVDLEPFDDIMFCPHCGEKDPMNVTDDYFTPWEG